MNAADVQCTVLPVCLTLYVLTGNSGRFQFVLLVRSFFMVEIILLDDVFRGNALWPAFHILLSCIDVLQRVKHNQHLQIRHLCHLNMYSSRKL